MKLIIPVGILLAFWVVVIGRKRVQPKRQMNSSVG